MLEPGAISMQQGGGGGGMGLATVTCRDLLSDGVFVGQGGCDMGPGFQESSEHRICGGERVNMIQ